MSSRDPDYSSIPSTDHGHGGKQRRRRKAHKDPDVTNADRCTVYGLGILACGTVEGVELLALYYEPFGAVGICFFLLFLLSSIFIMCHFWRHKKRRLFYASGLLLAVAMGLITGLWGGHELKQYWQYHEANAQEAASPSAKPSMFEQRNVFHFVDRAYVNTKLLGVVYRTSNLTYCVAPILGKDPVPQPSVRYWAVSTNCCAGQRKETVVQNCHHWTDYDLTGEVTGVDTDFYKLAVAKTADWHSFAAEPSAVFVVLMSRQEQAERQASRYFSSLLILIFSPFLWPCLAVLMRIIRKLVVCMCGVKPIVPVHGEEHA